ncbi:hypothetical protein PYCCODRAFT_1307699 [Trametes coccinea BRFM310]|uniref:Uncharacterized protein n=1 Tax=Trametes coccinea (strain BRFM310) TaxID=1353009 RepID=A0A1Y2I7K5_TRAC3|nr:hypothetical protein PYCCODRAFT_1307699 [Trametes coccinea BRFM310]
MSSLALNCKDPESLAGALRRHSALPGSGSSITNQAPSAPMLRDALHAPETISQKHLCSRRISCRHTSRGHRYTASTNKTFIKVGVCARGRLTSSPDSRTLPLD